MVSAGKTLGELLYENDTKKREALDVEFNKKNRVTVAQFASNEAIANTPRSPRFENSIPQKSDLSTDTDKKDLKNQRQISTSSILRRRTSSNRYKLGVL